MASHFHRNCANTGYQFIDSAPTLANCPVTFPENGYTSGYFTPQRECKRRGTGTFTACHRLQKPTAFSPISINYNFTCFSAGLTALLRTFSPSTLLSRRYGIPVFRSHTLSIKPKKVFFVWGSRHYRQYPKYYYAPSRPAIFHLLHKSESVPAVFHRKTSSSGAKIKRVFEQGWTHPVDRTR